MIFSSPRSSPLPLIIGFTGHREFRAEDIPILTGRVREIFQTLRKECPSTPLVLLTSLAEGADRIGARIAIESGIDYIVSLPMKREIYSTDFASEESKKE